MVQFASYLRRVLCKTCLIFPRINGPNVSLSFVGLEKVEQSESIICQNRRQREIIDIDLQDTDKSGSVLR